MTAHSAAAAGASSTELRLVPIQGLNSVEKQTIMPKGMMALLQGLQFAVPTWGFNALCMCSRQLAGIGLYTLVVYAARCVAVHVLCHAIAYALSYLAVPGFTCWHTYCTLR